MGANFSDILDMSESSVPQHWTSRVLTGDGVLSGVDALHDTFSLFLVQCVIILSICRLLGLLGARFNQPKVIFEIIGMNLTHSEKNSYCLQFINPYTFLSTRWHSVGPVCNREESDLPNYYIPSSVTSFA